MLNMTHNYNYLDFASHISFFEFLQEEFKESNFKTEKYLEEIKELSKKDTWDIEELANFLRSYPKSFEIFEEIFQLSRFTNTQLIYFLFDVRVLNSTNISNLIDYLKKNLEYDDLFVELFIKHSNNTNFNNIKFNSADEIIRFIENHEDKQSEKYLIFLLKATVISYTELAVKAEVVHNRISNSNFKDVSERIAGYLIKNLHLNEILKGIKIKEFLENKRIPIDTKSIHGNFGKIKISTILKKHGFVNGDPLFDKFKIKTLNNDLNKIDTLKELKKKFVFVTERYVEDVLKRKDNTPKKFDFILLYDLKPKIVIETNFYSTSGSKININEGEYIDLDEDIKKKHSNLIFIWVTDGNYWLTSHGKKRLLNLYNYFGDRILNYNLLDKYLDGLKEEMKQNI